MELQRVFLLLFCVAGIYSAYLTQGIVSEHLATKKYGPQQERFRLLETLNAAQSFTCFVWAFAILAVMRAVGALSGSKLPPWTAYWRAAITNSIGPTFGMYALKNISYSAQVLAKSCKMVPVMLMSTLVYGKRYSALEYVCMSLVGVGVSLFAQRSSTAVTSKLAEPNAPLGYFLCAANLVFDGYTNAAQDQINAAHPGNSPFHMMCWMNFWTTCYYCAWLFGASTAGRDVLAFCSRHPDAARDVALFCLCGAWGQLFIFFTIKTFGSLTNTLVCTTRKFFNILLSVLWNHNPLLPVQWAGVMMVFTGLISSSLTQHGKHKAAKRAAAKKQQ